MPVVVVLALVLALAPPAPELVPSLIDDEHAPAPSAAPIAAVQTTPRTTRFARIMMSSITLFASATIERAISTPKVMRVIRAAEPTAFN